MCGGVIQSTPYIGHPAYKEMGGRAGYTLATALFIGLGSILGYLSFFVDLLPEAAVAPILIFIGIEITAQVFEAALRQHYKAIALAFLPTIAYLMQIEHGRLLGNLGKTAADLTGEQVASYKATLVLGNGFIVTSLLWGAAFASLLDHRLRRAAAFLFICAIATLFGIIHSPLESGALFLPWAPPELLVWHLAAGYGVMGLVFLGMTPAVVPQDAGTSMNNDGGERVKVLLARKKLKLSKKITILDTKPCYYALPPTPAFSEVTRQRAAPLVADMTAALKQKIGSE
ncbi:MAG TPA: hypothetical protein VHN12_10620 [Geobacteraceae bacterium]|nr:hypothetical protein [Geobacteraceae bacterium]